MLPPVVHHHVAPAEPLPSTVQPPATPDEPRSRPVVAGRPETSPSAPAPEQYVATDDTEEVEDAPYTAPAKSPLGTILIIGGIVALLALVAYLMLGKRESERLTSISQTAADSLAVTPDVGPQAEQIDLPPASVPETIRVVQAAPPVVATPAPVDTATVPTAAATTEAPAANDNAATTRAQQVLESYYADLEAAPFSAAQYFAPNVERFYTMSNITPEAIDAELAKTHFPEFTEASTQIEPSSVKVSPPVADGSRVVTFLEKSKAFRQSLQKHQQTSAQVRVRLDKNFKIVYLRQEKLLENTFTD